MKKFVKSIITVSLLAFTVFFFIFSFPSDTKDTKIRLRFNTNYPGDTIADQKTGLAWALSFLGAEIPKKSFEKSLISCGANVYELDVNSIGFNETAINAFTNIIRELKASEEYKVMGGIDLGEFIIFTLGSSWHYYEITGAARNFRDYTKRFGGCKKISFPVLNSDVANHHRLVNVYENKDISKISFIAEEGLGELDKGTFKGSTYEVFDIMKNGQLRFAVYDLDGNLKAASERTFGKAGKPIKCLWCHEINIQPLFRQNDPVENYMTPGKFQQFIGSKMKALDNFREKLKGQINFKKTKEHALMELLYITYMEPSMYKLSGEWGVTETQLEKSLKNIKKHNHLEYPFLNNLAMRGNIKLFSPYTTVNLPDSIWEENDAEPNIFNIKR